MKRRIAEMDASMGDWTRYVEQSPSLRNTAAIFAHSGDSWFWLLGLILLWGFGSEYWKNLALILGISVIVTAIIVMAIKFTVKRSRPVGEWGKIYRNTDPHSFPSGHAVRAALLATLAVGLAPPWLGLLLVIWVPLVAGARVVLGVHYLSDVVAGMVIGLLLGLLYLRLI
ncbi:MAG: phosphatase PAP2 family protein [Anaerolineales bacterium]|nr:phosphatase PAP2 family protein [Anaerolineales bacterium]